MQTKGRTRETAAPMFCSRSCVARPSTTPTPPTDAISGPMWKPAGRRASRGEVYGAEVRGCQKTCGALSPPPRRCPPCFARCLPFPPALLNSNSKFFALTKAHQGDPQRGEDDHDGQAAAQQAQQRHGAVVVRVAARSRREVGRWGERARLIVPLRTRRCWDLEQALPLLYTWQAASALAKHPWPHSPRLTRRSGSPPPGAG